MRTKVRPALEAALAKVQSQKFHKWRNQRSGGGLRVEKETKRPTKANIYGQTRVSQATKPAASLQATFQNNPKTKNNTHGQIIQSKCLGTPHNPSCLYQSNCSDLTFLLHIHDVVFHTTIHLRQGLGQPRVVACFCMLRILEICFCSLCLGFAMTEKAGRILCLK